MPPDSRLLLHQKGRQGIDLFAGARGWEARAHKTLGVDLLGIEHWEPAVKTSQAAGLRTLHADVAALDPLDFADEVGEDGMVVGSPPCQSRSAAGKQLGKQDIPLVAACLMALADGQDTRAEHKAACADERSILTVEPLRWALALRPRVVLLEQVPSVLPDWELCGHLLERFGYSWWAGLLEAERYGVPQTRERAVLIARRDGVAAHPPIATHHRFVPKEPRPAASSDMLGGGLLPWVSMAEALGWEDGPAPAPAPTVTGGGGATGGVEVFASAGARARARGAVRTGNFTAKARDADGERSANGSEPYERDIDEPAPTVTGNIDRWRVAMRANAQANAAVRDANEPAPTITGGHDTANRQWIGLRAGTNANDITRSAEEPAPTIRFGGRSNDVSWVHERPAPTITGTRRAADGGVIVGRQLAEGAGNNVGGWGWERPATTVNGDPRISKPGHHDGNESGSQQRDAVRVTLEEAAILQSFPPDWPWQGTKTAQHTQVGNAVPPMLGEAILRTVVDEIELEEAA